MDVFIIILIYCVMYQSGSSRGAPYYGKNNENVNMDPNVNRQNGYSNTYFYPNDTQYQYRGQLGRVKLK